MSRTVVTYPHRYEVREDGVVVAECWDRQEAERIAGILMSARGTLVDFLRSQAAIERDAHDGTALSRAAARDVSDVLLGAALAIEQRRDEVS
jgi:hypothetical protein